MTAVDPDRTGGQLPAPARRRTARRRPVRRAMVVTHRWSSLVLGLLLVVMTTSGAVLLFQPEYFRATHGAFFRHTASAAPISAARAARIVQEAHPDFAVAWVNSDHGIFEVGDADYDAVYGVDPGSGRITGLAHLDGGTFGFLANLHECALSCAGYPGHLAFMEHPVPTGGLTFLDGLTWASVVLGILGVLLLLLAITGIVTWWPGIRRLSHGLRVRTGRGRFTRDYDLHRAVGAVAVPFLLMWGLTGAAFEFPVVENAWLAITNGTQPAADRYDFTAATATKGTPQLTLDQASAVALAAVPGRVVYAELPTTDTQYYGISIARSYDPYAHGLYPGDGYVYVDAHDAGHVKVAAGGPASVSNTFYERVLEPSHFGWLVNGWWRIIWALFGLTPLLLAATGLSTWLVRRGTRRARRQRAATPAAVGAQ